jgi:hypothetical protein
MCPTIEMERRPRSQEAGAGPVRPAGYGGGLRQPEDLVNQLLLIMDGAWVARMYGPGNPAAGLTPPGAGRLPRLALSHGLQEQGELVVDPKPRVTPIVRITSSAHWIVWWRESHTWSGRPPSSIFVPPLLLTTAGHSSGRGRMISLVSHGQRWSSSWPAPVRRVNGPIVPNRLRFQVFTGWRRTVFRFSGLDRVGSPI